MSVTGWILVGLVAIILLYLLIVVPWAKGQYKKDAYRLLKKSNPDPEEVRKTINDLNKFTGSLVKDEEVKSLISRLMGKLD